jgi:hypothetical protein
MLNVSLNLNNFKRKKNKRSENGGSGDMNDDEF